MKTQSNAGPLEPWRTASRQAEAGACGLSNFKAKEAIGRQVAEWEFLRYAPIHMPRIQDCQAKRLKAPVSPTGCGVGACTTICVPRF